MPQNPTKMEIPGINSPKISLDSSILVSKNRGFGKFHERNHHMKSEVILGEVPLSTKIVNHPLPPGLRRVWRWTFWSPRVLFGFPLVYHRAMNKNLHCIWTSPLWLVHRDIGFSSDFIIPIVKLVLSTNKSPEEPEFLFTPWVSRHFKTKGSQSACNTSGVDNRRKRRKTCHVMLSRIKVSLPEHWKRTVFHHFQGFEPPYKEPLRIFKE